MAFLIDQQFGANSCQNWARDSKACPGSTLEAEGKSQLYSCLTRRVTLVTVTRNHSEHVYPHHRQHGKALQPGEDSERKNDKELIWIYPLKGHKGRADAASAWRVKLQGLTQKVYFCSLLGLLQAANSTLHSLFGHKSAHKHPHSRDAQGCRSLGLLPGASLHTHLWDVPVNPRGIPSLLPKDNRTIKGDHN